MRTIIAFLVVLGCCSGAAPQMPSQRQSPVIVAGHRGPVILELRQRDRVIVVRAGRVGQTYSVRTKTGEVLISDMTMTQLAGKAPELSRNIQTLQSGISWAGE